MNMAGLQTMCASLSVSQRAADKLAQIHKSWTLRRVQPQSDFFHDRHAAFLHRHIAALSKQSRLAKGTLTYVACAYVFADHVPRKLGGVK